MEGLQAPDGTLNPVQQAFVDEFAVQCGFCIPGIIMSAMEMVNSGRTYTREEIRKNLSGHLCRCTGYMNVINGVEKAVDIVNGHVGAGEQDASDVDWSQRVKDGLEADCAR